jgi:SAM-dependent methyltransferase
MEASVASTSAEFAQLKSRLRSMWMAGDFGQIARLTAKAAEDFVERLDLTPGVNLLDVACGTGNTAIPAAHKGAHVTGVDIATNLLDHARQRARAEQVDVRFDEGDAEQLPYPENAFDVVITMFGAMFAPRPERVAAELVRVCRRGGRIVMANWTPDGFVGQQFALMARHVPPPPGIAPPVLWGDENTVRERFGSNISRLTCTLRTAEFNFPFQPKEAVAFFRRYFGPTQAAFARLDSRGQQVLENDLVQMWSKYNRASDGSTHVIAEYLEVGADK